MKLITVYQIISEFARSDLIRHKNIVIFVMHNLILSVHYPRVSVIYDDDG